jgi:ABC-2 type transport system ATP-binding protein
MVGRLYHMKRHDARGRARELLAEFDLVDAGDRLVRTYSGGMRRRLDLAAALVARPPVLFLDEPTTGLDPRSRLALWDTIESLVSGGATVLLTTQYLDEADRLADQIAVVDHGRVIAEGTPNELKENAGGEQLEVRLVDGSQGERALEALSPLACASPSLQDSTVRVPLRERKGAIAEAVRRLDSAGVAVDDLDVLTPTLDDVFLQLTGHGAEDEEEAA